jgi:hypothetical protein
MNPDTCLRIPQWHRPVIRVRPNGQTNALELVCKLRLSNRQPVNGPELVRNRDWKCGSPTEHYPLQWFGPNSQTVSRFRMSHFCVSQKCDILDCFLSAVKPCATQIWRLGKGRPISRDSVFHIPPTRLGSNKEAKDSTRYADNCS